MKKFSTLALVAVAGLAFVGGCAKNTKSEGSMGAVSKDSCSSKACCKEGAKKDAAGSMGAVSEKSCAGKTGTCSGKAAEGSMGAVSGTKTCAEKAASCTAKTTNN